MAVVKVIEVLSESRNGWEAAAQEAISEASRTVHDIRSVYVENFQAVVENDEIVNYRADCKISFVVHDKE
jgi:flavin-binding protein dodecin